MQSKVKKNQVDAIASQINVIQRMKDIYARMMGQEKYNKKIFALINQIPEMDRSANHSVSVTQSLQGSPGISILE